MADNDNGDTTNTNQGSTGESSSATPLNDSTSVSDSISSIALSNKIPKFWKDRPKLWFGYFEALMKTQRASDDAKAQLLITMLDKEQLEQIGDLLENMPSTGKYDALKKRLTHAYEDSPGRQLQRLLEEMELGDKKPSHLLRQMRDIAKNNIPDQTLKLLWVTRLPVSLRPHLHVDQSTDLENLGQLADRLYEYIKPHEVNSIASTAQSFGTAHVNANANAVEPQGKANLPTFASASSASNMHQINAINTAILQLDFQTKLDKLEKQFVHELSELRKQIEQLSLNTRHYRDRSRSRSRSRGRSSTCYYHRKFGTDAKKCVSPCNFTANASN